MFFQCNMEQQYILIEVEFGTPAYDECIGLRNEILREPLGLSFSVNDMLAERREFHFGLYDMNLHLIACATFRFIDENILKMRQVAVKVLHQRRGIGSILVRELEKWALARGFNEIELNARDVALKFYNRLDYTIEGDEFFEVGIPHRRMVKVLN